MIDYYSKRAQEYERIYLKPERLADLAFLRDHLRRAVTGRRVLELACGTGYWTAVMADCAHSIHATDASEEVLAIARAKQLSGCRVSFASGDAYQPVGSIPGYNAGIAFFWWSHIPRTRLVEFIHHFHQALQPGARVVFADNGFVEGSSTPICRTDHDGNTYQLRHLDDGSTYEVLKNFPSEAEIRGLLAPYADELEVTRLDYFWTVSYETRSNLS